MSEQTTKAARSPLLMSAADTALLVVDVQQKVLAPIAVRERIVWNARRLLDGARVLGVRAAATEQYPQGLGPTVAELAERLEETPAKVSFSCAGCGDLLDRLRAAGARKLLVCGIETHVCVQQTVLDALAAGYSVYVAADAVGSRHDLDHQIALERMRGAGATVTTTESALFEWCETAASPQFKQISALVKESPPA